MHSRKKSFRIQDALIQTTAREQVGLGGERCEALCKERYADSIPSHGDGRMSIGP